MARNKKNILSFPMGLLVLAIGIILLVCIVGWIYRDIRDGHITPEQIKSIKEIGEWEFLSISDEELVDTIRLGIFSNDRLARIYYGTLRLGVNLKQVEPGWIVARGDTIDITLPQIDLLDRDFIDEARTRSFYESGTWSPKDREAMLQRAYHKMLQRGMTSQNLQIAKQNGDAQVRQVLQSMGFKQVKIQYK